ncbi:MAG: nucleoside hydrolase [Paracoccaceae bacterium]
MRTLWVDTDFGFDDLWALLLLRHFGCEVAGVSLVAGNAPLAQVAANASAAQAVYGFNWPVWQGATRPLAREPETAARILGPTGMRSRGRELETTGCARPPDGALEAIVAWLESQPETSHEMLALGPLTNIAHLLETAPEMAHRISRVVWMGGSAGAGNHTPHAEFNAVADAEAVAQVAGSGLPFDIVDLTFCRAVTFGPGDMPRSDPLTSDLLGGYLDIGLERGRSGMAIYDPLAALAVAQPDAIRFEPYSLSVDTSDTDTYGATTMAADRGSHIRIAVAGANDLAQTCLAALTEEAVHGPRP